MIKTIGDEVMFLWTPPGRGHTRSRWHGSSGSTVRCPEARVALRAGPAPPRRGTSRPHREPGPATAAALTEPGRRGGGRVHRPRSGTASSSAAAHPQRPRLRDVRPVALAQGLHPTKTRSVTAPLPSDRRRDRPADLRPRDERGRRTSPTPCAPWRTAWWARGRLRRPAPCACPPWAPCSC
ncbi:hypothetical protein QJS66_07420 [Kocuria rhizophila]|nr:hypothetical protein QJS66_07420 [Kocuria rhizophila]